MGTSDEFIERVCQQIGGAGDVTKSKMYGEYSVKLNGRKVMIVCRNVAYVEILPCLDELMAKAEKRIPFPYAKEHYVLDIEDRELAVAVVSAIERSPPAEKEKKPK